MGLLHWIEQTGLAVYIREDAWGFAIALSFHAVGLAMVLGVVMVVTLRVLGYVKEIPILSYTDLFGAAWFGFIINLLSGFALYSSNPLNYTFQVVFIMKLLLLAAGGLLMKVLMNNVRAGADESKNKMIAGVCLACWLGAVITGRLMAYF